VRQSSAPHEGDFPLRRFRLLGIDRVADDGVLLRYERAR
jgi:hypothetical protein